MFCRDFLNNVHCTNAIKKKNHFTLLISESMEEMRQEYASNLQSFSLSFRAVICKQYIPAVHVTRSQEQEKLLQTG